MSLFAKESEAILFVRKIGCDWIITQEEEESGAFGGNTANKTVDRVLELCVAHTKKTSQFHLMEGRWNKKFACLKVIRRAWSLKVILSIQVLCLGCLLCVGMTVYFMLHISSTINIFLAKHCTLFSLVFKDCSFQTKTVNWAGRQKAQAKGLATVLLHPTHDHHPLTW